MRILDALILDDIDGVDVISLVQNPAIQTEFVAMSESLPIAMYNDDEMIIRTPALIANQLIYRNSEQLGEYYLRFTPEAIKTVVVKYFRNGNIDKASVNHDGKLIDGVFLFESYIINGNAPKDFPTLPDGSWFISMKIDNREVWDKIKSGELKGVSIEANLTLVNEQLQAQPT